MSDLCCLTPKDNSGNFEQCSQCSWFPLMRCTYDPTANSGAPRSIRTCSFRYSGSKPPFQSVGWSVGLSPTIVILQTCTQLCEIIRLEEKPCAIGRVCVVAIRDKRIIWESDSATRRRKIGKPRDRAVVERTRCLGRARAASEPYQAFVKGPEVKEKKNLLHPLWRT